MLVAYLRTAASVRTGYEPRLRLVRLLLTGRWYRKRHSFLPYVLTSKNRPSSSCRVKSFSRGLALRISLLVRGRVMRAMSDSFHNWYIFNGPQFIVYLDVYPFSLDLAGCSRTVTDTKKPAGLAPCGLLGLHRMTLVITDGEFWWAGGV